MGDLPTSFAPRPSWLSNPLTELCSGWVYLPGQAEPVRRDGPVLVGATPVLVGATPALDLRDGVVRYVVLRALEQLGHARPWALGPSWSPLTDAQAGCALAAILRAVGPDPAKPVAVVPVGVLGPWGPCRWQDEDPPACAVRPVVCGDYKADAAWRNLCFEWPDGSTGRHPHQDLSRDRASADAAARAAGALFLDELGGDDG